MASNDSQQSGKRSLADREGDQPPEGEADNEASLSRMANRLSIIVKKKVNNNDIILIRFVPREYQVI